jgi:hypothetical protein
MTTHVSPSLVRKKPQFAATNEYTVKPIVHGLHDGFLILLCSYIASLEALCMYLLERGEQLLVVKSFEIVSLLGSVPKQIAHSCMR